MQPILSGDENDSVSLTEEVSQLSTSTARGGFPKKSACESDPVFYDSSGIDPEMP